MQYHEGLVTKSTGSWITVKSQGRYISCKVRGTLRQEGFESTNPIVVGDKVKFEMVEGEDIGLIADLEERRNYLVRKSIKQSRRKHIIAANIDQALLVVTLKYPKTLTMFIDRFLLTAEAYRIPARLIFNKTDLYNARLKSKMQELMQVYEHIGYHCLEVSAETGYNMEAFGELLKDQISVIAGHSGVGKSTLLNRIDPDLSLKVAQISKAHKAGKHTTTFSEMHELNNGGYIIDTPGIKGFGLVDMERDEIPHYFPEMFSRLDQCRFYNCTHTHEPGCAVKEAAEQGEIAEFRYKNYLEILNSSEDKYREQKYPK